MQKTAMFILGSSLVLWLMTVGCFIPDSIRPGGLEVGDAFLSGTGLSLPLVVLGVINYWIIKKRRIEKLKELFTSGLFLAWLPNAAILALINIFVLIAFVWSGKPLQEGALIYVAVVGVWPLSAILGTIGAAITKKSKETSSQGRRTIRWSLKFLLCGARRTLQAGSCSRSWRCHLLGWWVEDSCFTSCRGFQPFSALSGFQSFIGS